MPKLVRIGSYGQNQALRAHAWAKNGPKTAEARPEIGITATGVGLEQDPRISLLLPVLHVSYTIVAIGEWSKTEHTIM
jgi:hypothetical protein